MGAVCSSCYFCRRSNQISPVVAPSVPRQEQVVIEEPGPTREYLQQRLNSAQTRETNLKKRLHSATQKLRDAFHLVSPGIVEADVSGRKFRMFIEDHENLPLPPQRIRHASAFVTTTDFSKVLLVYSTNNEGWELPGGKIEPNESPRHAALRELCEETGINTATVAAMKCVGCCVDLAEKRLMPIYIFVQEKYFKLEPNGETMGAWYFPLSVESLPAKLSYPEDRVYYPWIAARMIEHFQSLNNTQLQA